MRRLRIEVPATAANLGPGFDTLALALDLLDTVQVELREDSDEIVLDEVTGESAQPLDPRDNLLCRGYRCWSEKTGTALPGARFTVESRIPIGKGFGSSAASIVAGLAAGAVVAGEKQARQRILQLASQLEGHPDNAVAAVLGGMTAGFQADGRVHALNVVNHMALGIALFVPDKMLLTARARAIQPAQVPLADAVFDLGRLAYLTTALIWGRWELIGPAMQDRLHQPYRASLIPAMDDVIAAALEAGAYGAALSGGGPSIIALTPPGQAEPVAQAMAARAECCGWAGQSRVTQMREHGVRVHEVKEEGENQSTNVDALC